ncbi:MAG: S41 family peptidase [Candidatus Marinimicrobia bacterium]|jgi:carboxyl-terminal processing protease|nr:S41 family peptidase [Candidatus Neomarinimicrobiota bacterium]MCK9560050.1 S41 family peptidase [Candidatus Neomarinimicrobiota bacterium]MDD5062714.1 S41 family peptidase [Candidatus Neomarinimicrobiota bacterium]MDD5231496.1 S41 family peptidase [Candidatus Neomarinimicrobiota bacterium]
MKFNCRKSTRIWIAILVSVTFLLAFSTTDIYKEISDSYKLYNAVYRQILLNYADPIDASALTESNIRNMTANLDPYTVYMTEEEKEPLEILSKGEYGGVGLRISMRNDTLTVISPIDGSPGKKANILPGDQILKVDTVTTVGLDLNKSTRLIRGNVGTKVELLIRRPGISEDKVYILERAKISVNDISYTDYLKDGIGYIRLAEFSKGATAEIRQAIDNLKKRGKLESLVLDLRSNPGGLLEEALGVAELFTQPGDTLLLTRGRNENANRIYTSSRRPLLDESVKIAVLINGGSASASEIVAGIIQDLDRGVVVGSPSFGKGLVQTLFRVDKEHSVKITTAKYYIPSGRLIQKPNFIKNPKLIVSEAPQDSIFFSRNNRLLKSKGGITPDVVVEPESQSEYITDLWRQNQFYSFAVKYKTEHRELPRAIDDTVLDNFKSFLDKSGFQFTDKTEKSIRETEKLISEDKRLKNVQVDLQPVYAIFDSLKEVEFEANRLMIQRAIESQFAMLEGGLTGQIKADLKYDKVIAETIKSLDNDAEYKTTLGYAR